MSGWRPARSGASCGTIPVHKGMCRVLRDVVYRQRDPVRQHVVIRWVEGLPEKRDEPWFLMTDLGRDPRSLSRLYGKRMTVEELFRDDKNRRNGWGLRDVQVTRSGAVRSAAADPGVGVPAAGGPGPAGTAAVSGGDVVQQQRCGSVQRLHHRPCDVRSDETAL